MLRLLALFSAAVVLSPLASIAQTGGQTGGRTGGRTAQVGQADQIAHAGQVPYQPEPAPAEIQHKLDQAIGRPVYACHRTGLILLDTREQDGKPVVYYGAPANPELVGYMAPWKVVGIDKLNDVAGWSFFGLRVLVNGSLMVVNGIAVGPSELQSSPDLLQTLADKAHLFTSVQASGIRFTDLEAVREGEIHRGMSEQEVKCALGTPERSDADIAGELKDVYDGGRLVIYIADGSVANVQHLEERAAK